MTFPFPQDAEEHRIGFEFPAELLNRRVVVTSAHLILSSTAFSSTGPLGLEVSGYPGDGVVGLADMSPGTAIAGLSVTGDGTLDFDVQAYLQSLSANPPSHAGFLVRLLPLPPTAANLGIYMTANPTPALRPRLELSFCVNPFGTGC